jgi:hypothetical protein
MKLLSKDPTVHVHFMIEACRECIKVLFGTLILYKGTGSFPGVKRPGRGADHPPPSSAEVEKE